jgi:Family of unknown function (DUF6481)
MNRSKNADFAERLSTAADAKKAQLERAARARSAAESPTAIERRRAREIDAALHQGDKDGERSEVLKKEKG